MPPSSPDCHQGRAAPSEASFRQAGDDPNSSVPPDGLFPYDVATPQEAVPAKHAGLQQKGDRIDSPAAALSPIDPGQPTIAGMAAAVDFTGASLQRPGSATASAATPDLQVGKTLTLDPLPKFELRTERRFAGGDGPATDPVSPAALPVADGFAPSPSETGLAAGAASMLNRETGALAGLALGSDSTRRSSPRRDDGNSVMAANSLSLRQDPAERAPDTNAISHGDSAPGNRAGSGFDSPAPSNPPLATAHVLERMSHSEMRVGVSSEEFGRIQLQTRIAQDQLKVMVTTSHSGLQAAMAAETPSLEKAIAQHHLKLDTLSFQPQYAGSDSGNPEDPPPRQPAWSRPAPPSWQAGDSELGPETVTAVAEWASASPRLNLHA